MCEIDWTQVFTVINALGSIATVGAFLVLFRKDKEKQTQIDKLTRMAEELKEMKIIDDKRLNISLMPEIKLTNTHQAAHNGELELHISNIGERAVLTRFELISDDIILHNEHLPFTMQKDEKRIIFTREKTQKHIKDCKYEFIIHYNDKAMNHYATTLKGIGGKCRVVETKLIKDI